MKKIYAVYCVVKLTKQPIWLDEFRKEYDEAYDFHITLKQAACIDDSKINEIRKILDSIITNFQHDKRIVEMTFDQLMLDEAEGYIYLFANNSRILDRLQIQIRDALKNYSNYVNSKSSDYEYNFKPHITIARNLDKQRFKEANTLIDNDYICEGQVTEIVLSCVKEISVEEAHNPNNLTKYQL